MWENKLKLWYHTNITKKHTYIIQANYVQYKYVDKLVSINDEDSCNNIAINDKKTNRKCGKYMKRIENKYSTIYSEDWWLKRWRNNCCWSAVKDGKLLVMI